MENPERLAVIQRNGNLTLGQIVDRAHNRNNPFGAVFTLKGTETLIGVLVIKRANRVLKFCTEPFESIQCCIALRDVKKLSFLFLSPSFGCAILNQLINPLHIHFMLPRIWSF